MQFKDEIKEKSQIRQLLGDVSEAVIKHFENWWDKYSSSLDEINSEVKESEIIMNKFLKELGYE